MFNYNLQMWIYDGVLRLKWREFHGLQMKKYCNTFELKTVVKSAVWGELTLKKMSFMNPPEQTSDKLYGATAEITATNIYFLNCLVDEMLKNSNQWCLQCACFVQWTETKDIQLTVIYVEEKEQITFKKT